MASILRFDNWQNSDGTSIATTDASGNISFAGSLGATGGVGKILQVVNGTTSTEVATTAGYETRVSTGLTATITPTSTASIVLAFASVPITIEPASTFVSISIHRGTIATGINLATPYNFLGSTYSGSASGGMRQQVAVFASDTPATTSETTYTVSFASTNGKVCKGNNHPANLLLMEVSA
jgi:hypothetical protein